MRSIIIIRISVFFSSSRELYSHSRAGFVNRTAVIQVWSQAGWAQALESGAHTLGVLVVFHWRVCGQNTSLQEGVGPTSSIVFTPSPLLGGFIIHSDVVFLQHSQPPHPSLSPSQFLNSTARNNHRQVCHPQHAPPSFPVTMSTDPSHHCTSCHWCHDDCLGSAKARARQCPPISPSVPG